MGLGAAFALLTWFAAGPLKAGHIDTALNADYDLGGFTVGLLHGLDRIGQRAVCLPILIVVVLVVSWRHRSARPVLVAVVTGLAINILVAVLKLWLGRGAPLDHQPAFFVGGEMYPSGHTGNVSVVYGTCAYLVSHYTEVSQRVRRLMVVAVVVLGVVMTITSLLLRFHWFTDLIGGYLVGGCVLAVVITIDRAVPFRSRALVVIPPDALPVEVPGETLVVGGEPMAEEQLYDRLSDATGQADESGTDPDREPHH